jgi:hypothetical protein
MPAAALTRIRESAGSRVASEGGPFQVDNLRAQREQLLPELVFGEIEILRRTITEEVAAA